VTIVKSHPLAFPTIDRVMSQFLNDPFFSDVRFPASALAAVDEGTLALDVSEDDDNVFVRATVPGFTKDQIDLSVHDGVVSINAQHAEERQTTNERFYRKERRVGSLSRRIALPSAVADDRTTAELKDGVLTLTLPKIRKEEPRKIAIK
jgi:HSP20 family protein